MLVHLHLTNVGPAPEMRMDLGPRLNLVTGDNGLGKSFLLDVAWWALTRKWPRDLNPLLTSGYRALPRDPKRKAQISFGLTSKTRCVEYTSTYSARDEAWTGRAGRPWNPGLVVYAHADGGFSVWDPARNYWRKKDGIDLQERLPGYVLSAREVWDGLTTPVDGKPALVCNGLLRDWSTWLRAGTQEAKLMEEVLRSLSPSERAEDRLMPGGLKRLSVNEPQDIPCLRTPYGEVPIVHASSGVRRVAGLAYILVWSLVEHIIAANLLGEMQTSQVVLLVDEIESHLHPRWQRSILRSVLQLANHLHDDAAIQVVTATHSPLILAAAEPLFDPEKDAWFDLDLEGGPGHREVVLRKRPFVRRGDVSSWLTSEAFDLKEARSLEAEEAIQQALALTRQPKPKPADIRRVDGLLRGALSDVDRFWVRWTEFKRANNGAPARRAK